MNVCNQADERICHHVLCLLLTWSRCQQLWPPPHTHTHTALPPPHTHTPLPGLTHTPHAPLQRKPHAPPPPPPPPPPTSGCFDEDKEGWRREAGGIDTRWKHNTLNKKYVTKTHTLSEPQQRNSYIWPTHTHTHAQAHTTSCCDVVCGELQRQRSEVTLPVWHHDWSMQSKNKCWLTHGNRELIYGVPVDLTPECQL